MQNAENNTCTKMFERRKYRRIFCSMLFIFICGLVYIGYFMGEDTSVVKGLSGKINHHLACHNKLFAQNSFTTTDLHRDYNFDIEGDKVLVFLHIQKTGGTSFGKHLVRNIDLDIPCECYKGKKKRCDCQNSKKEIWLFSRYSTGWICGLHADWTELQACVNEMMDKKEGGTRKRRYNRYLYITSLRDPVNRYLSEWRHVQRGSTWYSTKLKCNGREASLEEVPFCFEDEDWSGVSLNEFAACPHNLAKNRQTRMLANLSLVGCYNKSYMTEEKRNCMILQSAKDNLRNMAFFGLTEYQVDTQYMFERTFHLKFIEDFIQHNATHANSVDITEEQKKLVLENNQLDIELYKYAKQLFFERLKNMKEEDQRNGVVFNKRSDNRGVIFTNSNTNKKQIVSDINKIEEDEQTDEDYDAIGEMEVQRTRRKHSGIRGAAASPS